MDDRMSHLPQLPPWSTVLWIVLGFFLISFGVYGASVAANDFVLWDDNSLIVFNAHIRSLHWSNIAYNFTHFDPELYIPLTFLSYQLDYALAGLSPSMFHLTNLVLHTLNAVLVSTLLYLLTHRGRIALVCGALFLVHPLHTEAVAWAAARKDVLSAFFFLLSAILYLRFTDGGDRKLYWWSIGAFLLGLLAKVMVLTLPFALLFIDLFRGRRITRSVLLEKIPYLLLSGTFGAVGLFAKEQTVSLLSPWETVLIGIKATAMSLQHLFVPLHLSVLYPYTGAIGLSVAAFWIPLLALCALGLIAVGLWRKTKVPLLCAVFFLLMLSPTFLNVVKGGEVYITSDRYAYLPSIGVLLFLAWLLGCNVPEGRSERVWTRGLSAVVLAGALLSARQAETWRNSEALFSHAIAQSPDAIAARLNLAMVYLQDDRQQLAIQELDAAKEIHEHSRIYTTLATIRERQGKRTEAYALYRKAAEIDPKDPEPHVGLGLLFSRDGDIAAAEAEYHKALALQPYYTTVYLDLAALALQQQDFSKATGYYEGALRLDPDIADAHFNLGILHEDAGNLKEAAHSFEEVIRIDPRSADAYTHLAPLYLKLGRKDDAIALVLRFHAIAPGNEEAEYLMQTFQKHGLIQ